MHPEVLAKSIKKKKRKPFVTIAIAAYNESSLLEKHLDILYTYMQSLKEEYDWELVIVNDGSTDATGAIIEKFAKERSDVIVLHHRINDGLGQSLQDAFAASQGDYVITLDIDLSCSPEHIERLLNKMRETEAKIVVASPTMKGGKMRHVPWHRKILSKGANRFLALFAFSRVSNLTCMVRAYNGPFIRSLNFRAKGMEIMPEIISKTLMLQEKIEQIPAYMDWSLQKKSSISRQSSMKIFQHTLATLITGFLLRPFLFFIFPGFLLFLFSIYPNVWMFIHFITEYATATGTSFLDRASNALEVAYRLHPHTFLIGLVSLLLSIQLIALGFLSFQSKHYFEEMFHIATKIYKKEQEIF